MTEAPVVLSQQQFETLLGRLTGNNGNGNNDGAATPGSSKLVKPSRPTIDIDTSESEWSVFEDQWARFKRMAKLTVIEEIRDNLRQCCSPQLNKRLFDVKGAATLNAASEEDLLSWIKEIAVKGVHTEVHRTQFVHCKQKQGESLNSYHGRLKSESKLCDFRVPAPASCSVDTCTCANHGMQISYQDDMVATQLIAGLYNSEHQAKVLSESATLLTLEDKLKRLLVLEKSDTSLSTLAGNDATVNMTRGNSQDGRGADNRQRQRGNKRKKKITPATPAPVTPAPRPSNNDNICVECGENHPQCPTCKGYHKCSTQCNFCKKYGHIRNCCRNLLKQQLSAITAKLNACTPQTEEGEEEEVAFGYSVQALSINKQVENEEPLSPLSSVTLSISIQQISKHMLSHMEHDGKSFHVTKPSPAPMIHVTCKVIVENHMLYERKPKGRPRPAEEDGLADTGAQVCTGGPDLLTDLRVNENILIPTKLEVKGITHSRVTMLGALFLEVSSNGVCTKQIVYIAREARSLILSETALKDLGVLPPDFPTAGSFKNSENTSVEKVPNEKSVTVASKHITKNACGCPARTEVPPLPTHIPIEKPEANRSSLHKWILNYYRTSAFNVCTHQLIPCLTGPEMRITTVEGAEPVAVHTPIPVPHYWKKNVKRKLDENCNLGVMQEVKPGTPVTWQSRLIVTPKKNGDLRLVVDLQPLNAVSKRETHHTPSPWNLACSVPKGMLKSILDAWNGYHLVPLAPESQEKTTFITEWGRYQYLRAPQGWTGSGDAFTKRFDDITAEVKDVARCIDDSCLWAANVAASFWHVVNYIDLCARNGVIFNPDKFLFALQTLDFAGYTVTLDSIKPTSKMHKAIMEFPTPTTIKGIRGWFGVIAFVSFAYALSPAMLPFRDLLASKKKFYWDDELEELFKKTKSYVVDMVIDGVRMFEMARHTCLATDWSKTGLGFFLLQKHCNCVDLAKAPCCGPGHWKLIFAGSRFTKDVETRYSPIEGEALAVVFALEQARMFVLGCPRLIVATDHKPLVPILNGRRLDLITNPRLLKFREKTLMYQFTAQHIRGPLNIAADAASRNPSSDTGRAFLVSVAQCSAEDDDTGLDTEELHSSLVHAIVAKDDEVVSWSRVKSACKIDDTCMHLIEMIENGFPQHKSEVEECLRPFHKLKDELYTVDGVPCLSGRIFIPKALRKEVLSTLHSAHQGVSGMKTVARGRFWWLGMNSDIEQTRFQCRDCNEGAPSNVREPMLLSPEPEFPWQQAVMDYFEYAALKFLVIADRFTGWPEVFRLNGKAITLVKTCRNLFAQFGVPEELSFDGGPPFDSYEWKQFMIQWDIGRRQSSANYPQSNGRAELAVKSCKRLIKSNIDGHGNVDTHNMMKALLQYRNTPSAITGMSPAYMLYGRQLRDALPTPPAGSRDPAPSSYADRYGKPSAVWDSIKKQRELTYSKKRLETTERYNTNTRTLPPLSVGDSVSIQNKSGPHPLRWDRTGQVVERLENRQYLVKCDGSGRTLLRTRTHLRKICPSTRNTSQNVDATPGTQPLLIPGSLQNGTKVIHPIDSDPPQDLSSEVDNQERTPTDEAEAAPPAAAPPSVEPPSVEPPPVEHSPVEPPRRSTRRRVAPERLSPTMKGKSHDSR